MSTNARLGLLILASLCNGCAEDAVPAPADAASPEISAEQLRLDAFANMQVSAPSMTSSEAFVLPEEKQHYLRDTELLVLVLGQDVWPKFQAVLLGQPKAPLAALLAEDFEASVLRGDGQRDSHGPVTLYSWSDDERDLVDGEGLLNALASYGARFETIESAKFHVTQLSPQIHGNLTGGWDARWDMHLKGILANGDRAEFSLVCELQLDHFNEGILSGDDPETEWIDDFTIVQANFVAGPSLMRDITSESGIDSSAFSDNWERSGPPYFPITGGASLLDFDRDGISDLLVTGESQPYLYRGKGDGTFEDVSRTSKLANGLPRVIQAALVADLDNDSYEDIVLMILGRQKLADGRVLPKLRYELYANLGDGTFQRLREDEHNLNSFRFETGFIGTAIADFDGDGLIDIYSGKGGKPAPKSQRHAKWLDDSSSPQGLLLRNLGNWHFEDATDASGMTGKYVDTFGALWLDVEPDGDADLFLANHMGPNVLWINAGDGTFASQPIDEGFGGFSMGAAFDDLDGDGDPDLYVANMYSSAGSRILDNLREEDYPPGTFANILGFVAGNTLYDNVGSGELTPHGVDLAVDNAGWAYGPGLVDLDGDGRLDIYAPAGFQSVSRDRPDT